MPIVSGGSASGSAGAQLLGKMGGWFQRKGGARLSTYRYSFPKRSSFYCFLLSLSYTLARLLGRPHIAWGSWSTNISKAE